MTADFQNALRQLGNPDNQIINATRATLINAVAAIASATPSSSLLFDITALPGPLSFRDRIITD